MILHQLRRADLKQMAQAVRNGEPVDLQLTDRHSREVRLDEIAPLIHSYSADHHDVCTVLERFRAPLGLEEEATGTADCHSVTVVVPCNRGVPLGLEAFLAQDVPVRVLLLSNGSKGPKAEDVDDLGERVDVKRIEWRGHGASRMKALESVNSTYVFFSVDDAMPLGRGFFRTLVQAMEAESDGWDAVVARQIPWPDADRVTKARLRKWTPAGTCVVETAQVDNVGTLYRTEYLREHPFPTVPIAEDAWWSQGKRIGYVPLAPVVHSHTRSALALFRRNRDIHGELVRMGAPATVPSDMALIKSLPTVMRPLFYGEVKEVANQLGELLGQWRAVRFTQKSKRLN